MATERARGDARPAVGWGDVAARAAARVLSRRGYLESATACRNGVYLLTGWGRTADLSGPAPLAIAGGTMLVAAHARPDLPEDHTAFTAVALTGDTRPRSWARGLMFRGRGGGTVVLPRLLPMVQIAPDAALEAAVAQGAERDRAALLARLLGEVGDVAGRGLEDVAVAVDKVLLLPGFGAFVTGWALSRTHRLASVEVAVGAARLQSTPDGIGRAARPDLGLRFEAEPERFAEAGVAAVCRGALGELAGQVVVSYTFGDGHSRRVRVPPHVPVLLDRAESFAALENDFPWLPADPAAAEVARAAGQILPTGTTLRTLRAGRMDRAVAVALPSDPSDAAMVLDQIGRPARDLPQGTGLVILMRGATARAPAVALAEALAADGTPAFVGAAEGPPGHVLAGALDAVSAERAVFVEDYALPTSSGWQEIAAFLTAADPGPAAMTVSTGIGAALWPRPDAGWAAGLRPTLTGSVFTGLRTQPGVRLISGALVQTGPLPAGTFLSRLERA